MAAHPDIKGIFAACPETAAAAAEYASNESSEVKIISFDYNDEIISLINKGQICGTVGLSYFELGYETVKTAATSIADQSMEGSIMLDFETIVREDSY